MAQIFFLSLGDVIEKRYLDWRALCIFSHLIKNFLVKMIYSLAIPVLIALFNSAHCARNSPPSTSLRQRSDFSVNLFHSCLRFETRVKLGQQLLRCDIWKNWVDLQNDIHSTNSRAILSESSCHFVKLHSFSNMNAIVSNFCLSLTWDSQSESGESETFI